jgi:hypothetical protein
MWSVFLPPVLYAILLRVSTADHPFVRRVARVKLEHNVAMTLFSLWIVVRMGHTLWREERLHPVSMMCRTPVVPDWTLWNLWYASKLWEWVDTLLLIRARKPVSALHSNHHMSTAALVAIQTWGRDVYTPMSDVGTLLNAGVHAIMYAYYVAPRALRPLRRWITGIQIAQHAIMVVGMTLLIFTRHWFDCDVPVAIYSVSLGAYALYLMQFVHFFRTTY